MKPVTITRTCKPCGRKFITLTGTFKLKDKRSENQQPSLEEESSDDQIAEVGEEKVTPIRLTLLDWSVFSAPDFLLTPQQAEAVVCNWLQTTVTEMDLLGKPFADDKPGPNKRLYGKITFDQMGDLYDFEISKLNYKMLSLGFDNWMSTLASGELLLDIANRLIEECLANRYGDDSSNGLIFKAIPPKTLPVRRLLDSAPNKLAACSFLLNHYCLIDKFLDPILSVIRDAGLPPPDTKPGTAGNIRQALQMVRPVGHNLLRSCYSAREWTWKALMLLVLILMAMVGSLDKKQEMLLTCLSGEFDISQLIVPELQQAMLAIKQSNPVQLKGLPVVDDLRWALPYRRVLKRGPIDFDSVVVHDFGLLEDN